MKPANSNAWGDVASAGGISGFDCISRRGRQDDLDRRDIRPGRLGFTSKLILEALRWAMKLKELIEKVAEELHAVIEGGRLPRPFVFGSIANLSQALLRANDARSELERGLGAKD